MATEFAQSGQSGRLSEFREGAVAKGLEHQTAKIPSDVWLWAAFASIGAALGFQIAGNEKYANFLGHWAPTFLLLGVYNKLVKQHGSDAFERQRAA